MKSSIEFLVLPREVSDFESAYLRRVNRIALGFFLLHVPVLATIAYLNRTGPGLAVLLSFLVTLGPILAERTLTNPRAISVCFGITAMLMGGLLVHFGQGPVQIEMHFYFFALVAMCAVFGNPMVIVAAAVTVALHHLIVWLVLPQSVFNYAAEWWVVAVHAVFVVLESIATCFIARSFFDNVIGLEKIVRSRTRELDQKNQDMRLLLDNVQQGFVTIDESGQMAKEHSAALSQWFGTPAGAESWFDYLATISPQFADRSRLGFEEVVEGVMPEEVVLGQMPALFAHNGAHFRVQYLPIRAGSQAQHYLVIVTDVTTEVERQQAELERSETMALFERVLLDRAGVESFVEDTNGLLEALSKGTLTDLATAKRLLHTLKGNAACFGLVGLAAECHELEDLIEESGGLLDHSSYGRLASRWQRLAGNFERMLGKRANLIEIDPEQYATLEGAVRAGESGLSLLQRIRALKLEATAKRLNHFAEQAKRIAERLDKSSVDVKVEDHGLRLDHGRWGAFWAAFIHAVRNALDHGIESPEERAEAGKAMQATLALRTLENQGDFVIEIEDDGRGIDWDRIAERARAAGLPYASRADLERALFVDGFSTAVTVSDLSGRGVGMGALLSVTEALGGRLDIESQPQRGTRVRFRFPTQAMHALDSLRPLGLVSN